jgi:hypothetical protein
MLGYDVIEDQQAHYRAINKRLQEANGDAFEWDNAYEDPEADRVSLDAVAAMAAYFRGLEKRTAWFLGIINNQLAPPNTARKGDDPATWQLTEAAFHHFLTALFAEVRQTMAREGSPAGDHQEPRRRGLCRVVGHPQKLKPVGVGN